MANKVKPTPFNELHCVADFCHGMVANNHGGELLENTPEPYGAVVDLSSGGCLYVPGMHDPGVVSRINKFMSKSRECVAAWASEIVSADTQDVVVNLQWGSQFSTIEVPCSSPDFHKLLTEVVWTSPPNYVASEHKHIQSQPSEMSIIKAEKILREFVELAESKFLHSISVEQISNTQQAEEFELQGQGWFIDRECGDMFFDKFFRGFSEVSTSFQAIRDRLETFASGRKAVTFAIAMYSNGIHVETKIWSRRKPFWGW